jgi:lipoprotein NlpD
VIKPLVVCLLLVCSIAACSERPALAPVVNGGIEKIPRTGLHKVVANETVYSIAWRYGLDYRDLAAFNGIQYPYKIKSGRYIAIRIPAHRNFSALTTASTDKKVVYGLTASPRHYSTVADQSSSKLAGWRLPAKGRLIGYYSSNNKGINIAGKRGNDIVAANNGKIVYAGNGLRGYGNLIIIKHSGSFLTAYAHSDKILVKMGDAVVAGQRIALMGNTGSKRVMLHFEIRQNGRPVNPLVYLSNWRYN